MLTLKQLSGYLTQQKADFSILAHPKSILSLSDAAEYFDPKKSVPAFLLDNGEGLIAFFSSSGAGPA